MIVYGMNEKEVSDEVLRDLKNVYRYEDAKRNKFRRRVLKATTFPVYYCYTYISPLKNKWVVILEARNKNEVLDKCRVTFSATYNTPHGIYSILVTFIDGRPVLCFYPPHFFRRYKERSGKDKTGIDLIVDYFTYNSGCLFRAIDKVIDNETYISEVFGTINGGIVLGLMTSENNFLLKTFVSVEMLKGSQIEDYMKGESIRNEILY
ncbi:MAG TPA: hypothetical protein DDW85_02395 [Porphyromonadaceae bacterium]|nr:hypothetical protein [Porphyromonadaceae bacterium]